MAVYTNPIIDQELSSKAIFYLDNKCAIFTCNGSPEGVILASTGSIAISDNGSVYKKTTDDINTGWVELTGGTISSPFVISGTNPTLSFVDTDVGDDDGSISMQSDIMSLGVVPGTQVQINGAAALSLDTVKGFDATGLNSAGVDVDIAGGPATGNAIPGNAVARYPLIAGSSSTVQALSANAYPISTNLFTNITAGTAIQNTVVETSLFTGVTGAAGTTRTIEGGISRAGTKYTLRICCNANNTGTPTLQIRVKLGASTIIDSGAAVTTAFGSGRVWIDIDIYVLTIGAAGLVVAYLRFDYSNANTGTATVATINGATGGSAIDFTAAQVIDVTAQWGTASASNILQLLGVDINRQR